MDSRRSGGGSAARAVSRGTQRAVLHPHAGAQLVVDGILGPLTTHSIQIWVGTRQDGIFGPVTRRALAGKIGARAYHLTPSRVAALQRLLNGL